MNVTGVKMSDLINLVLKYAPVSAIPRRIIFGRVVLLLVTSTKAKQIFGTVCIVLCRVAVYEAKTQRSVVDGRLASLDGNNRDIDCGIASG